jgi:hypothetical protein
MYITIRHEFRHARKAWPSILFSVSAVTVNLLMCGRRGAVYPYKYDVTMLLYMILSVYIYCIYSFSVLGLYLIAVSSLFLINLMHNILNKVEKDYTM